MNTNYLRIIYHDADLQVDRHGSSFMRIQSYSGSDGELLTTPKDGRVQCLKGAFCLPWSDDGDGNRRKLVSLKEPWCMMQSLTHAQGVDLACREFLTDE